MREAEEESRRENEIVIMASRKAEKEKMLKGGSKGQSVMKYRIQHILGTLQGSSISHHLKLRSKPRDWRNHSLHS
ncbi:hypothetical protein SAY87_019956 [Trapa incisa]|uniref:Uncharacterized protein n=1 Tax=Trapa incisa TaxID=236973 RepID=A0AAN7K0N8_9MYRT|nr:hypothetical protein SAY87_019956 [Trapa incisa]